MRTHGFLGIAALAVLLPATAIVAADVAPPPAAHGVRTWGGVPNVTLQAPPQHGPGWTPGGWQGGAAGGTAMALPPGHPPVPMAGGMPPLGGPRMAPGAGGMPPHGMTGRPGGWNGAGHGGWSGGGYALRRGYRLPGTFLAPSYFISDWSTYGLAQPGFGNNWVRYYDGAALVDRYGTVQDYRDRVNWGDGRGRGGSGGYDGGYADGYDDGFEDGADHVEDAVTYGGSWHRGGAHGGSAYGGGYGAQGYGYHGGGYGYGPGAAQVYSSGGATVVVVQGAPAVTTTTTTVEEVSYTRAAKRTWRKPVRVWRAKPRCVCTTR